MTREGGWEEEEGGGGGGREKRSPSSDYILSILPDSKHADKPVVAVG